MNQKCIDCIFLGTFDRKNYHCYHQNINKDILDPYNESCNLFRSKNSEDYNEGFEAGYDSGKEFAQEEMEAEGSYEEGYDEGIEETKFEYRSRIKKVYDAAGSNLKEIIKREFPEFKNYLEKEEKND